MFTSKTKKQLSEIRVVLEHSEAGIYKRLDENRELLELLMSRSPELIRDCPWVVGWIRSQDNFLVAVSRAASIPPHRSLPRPWPGGNSQVARPNLS